MYSNGLRKWLLPTSSPGIAYAFFRVFSPFWCIGLILCSIHQSGDSGTRKKVIAILSIWTNFEYISDLVLSDPLTSTTQHIRVVSVGTVARGSGLRSLPSMI